MAVHTVLLDGPGGGQHGSRGPGPPALRNVLSGKPDHVSELPRTRVWGYCVPSGALRKGDRFTSCPKQDRFENQDTADQRAMGADVNGTTLGGPSGRHTAPRGVTACVASWGVRGRHVCTRRRGFSSGCRRQAAGHGTPRHRATSLSRLPQPPHPPRPLTDRTTPTRSLAAGLAAVLN